MADKEPVLVVFDIDGTVAKTIPGYEEPDIYNEARLAALEPWPNMISVVQRYMAMQNVEIMFCSGRPQSCYRVTWDWLNRHIGMSSSGRRVTLTLRPNKIPEEQIATYKISEIMQAIRRLGSKPSEALIFDDELSNLQMFEVIRPMVKRLRLYRVENGVTSQWGD